jgi:hypothetical protein
MRIFLFLSAVLLISLPACGGVETITETPQNSEPVQYPMEVKQAVIDEAFSIIQSRGFWPEIVAGLGYSADSFTLAFYGEADPEVVEIVQSVIDDKALGFPLEIVENVTIVTQTQTITVTETKTVTVPAQNNEAIVQIWESEELVATGVVVGDGSQVLTVLNYEVDTPDSLNLSIVAHGNGEYEASVQAIDSRTSASLLKIEGGKLPIATIGNVQTLLPEQRLRIRDWCSTLGGNGEPEMRETSVLLYGGNQVDLPLFFHVVFPMGEPQFPNLGRGAVVTDESGNVLGLVGIDYVERFPTPPGFIPRVVSIDVALKLLSPDANQQPWANGPLFFTVDSSTSTKYYFSPLPNYANIATSLQELLGKIGEPLPSTELPQDFHSRIPGEAVPASERILTVVYASPVDLRDAGGAVVARSKWIGIIYNTEARPYTLFYGNVRTAVTGGSILMASLSDFSFIPYQPNMEVIW